MKSYIGKRVIASLILLLIATFFIFFIFSTLPGSVAQVLLGEDADSLQVRNLEERLGLEKSFLSRYLIFLKNIISFNFGNSLITGEPVFYLIANCLLPTFELAIMTFLFLLFIFIPLAVLNSSKPDSKLFVLYISVSLSIPSFVFAFLLMFFLAFLLPVFPLSGYKVFSSGFFIHFFHLILPSFSLALSYSGLLMKLTNIKAAQIRRESYYLNAVSRGLGFLSINFKYLFYPTLSSILSVFTQSFISLLSGVAIIESIFNIPGLGFLLVSSVLKRDYPTCLAIVIFLTFISVLLSFVSDLFVFSLNRKRGAAL